MKVKKALLMLTVLSLLVAIPAFALNEPGDLPKLEWGAPEEPIVIGAETVTFEWMGEEEKYSVDIEGLARYYDALLDDVVGVEVEISLGTSDWNEDMSESRLAIAIDDLAEVIAIELGLSVDDELLALTGPEEGTYASAKVKGLDPSVKTGKKRQNNLFSDPVDFPDYLFFF